VTANNVLIDVSTSQPAVILSAVGLRRLSGDVIVGIDDRPAAGEFLGIAAFSLMYRLFPMTGACVQGGPAGGFAPSAAAFGVDFNPVVDRIRVVSEGVQNLRLNPTTGVLTAADSALAYAVGDINVAGDPHIVSVAYSNNVGGAAVTTL
jgi:hypothetical protein